MAEKEHNPKRKGTKKKVTRGIALEPATRLRFRQLRCDAKQTTSELAQAAHVSERVIKNIESSTSERTRFDENTLTKIVRALGKSLDEVILDHVGESIVQTKLHDFDTLERLSQELDDVLIPLIRDLRNRALARDTYQVILGERLRRNGITLDQHLDVLNSRTHSASWFDSLPDADLTVDIDDDFARISFCFRDVRIEVKSPRLLWDCGCTTTQSMAQSKKCPIHKHPEGAELAARFNGGQVLFRFRGAQYRWRSHAALWPPSVDSFAMYRDLENEGVFRQRIGSLLDLGCGTGLLGIGVALQNPNVVDVTLADWLLTPLLYSRTNWLLSGAERTHINMRVRLGLFTDWLEPAQRPFDLAVCNPPYLPLFDGFDDLGLESTVAGTDLLEHVIRHGSTLARQVFVQFSELATASAQEAAQQAGVRLVPVGPSRNVPFRVSNVWNRPEYLAMLQERCGLRKRQRDRHRYWHRIQTYRIQV